MSIIQMANMPLLINHQGQGPTKEYYASPPFYLIGEVADGGSLY